MASYNGLVSSLIKGSSTGGENAVLTGVSYSAVVAAVPAKYFNSAVFAVKASGVSGTIAVDVVGSVGGVTFVIAGNTGLTGNAVIGLSTSTSGMGLIYGTRGTETGFVVPRPAYVAWASAENGSGFTGSVFMAGEYS